MTRVGPCALRIAWDFSQTERPTEAARVLGGLFLRALRKCAIPETCTFQLAESLDPKPVQ